MNSTFCGNIFCMCSILGLKKAKVQNFPARADQQREALMSCYADFDALMK